MKLKEPNNYIGFVRNLVELLIDLLLDLLQKKWVTRILIEDTLCESVKPRRLDLRGIKTGIESIIHAPEHVGGASLSWI